MADLVYIPFPPDHPPENLTWDLQGLSTGFSSPGGVVQTIERTSIWKATLSYENLEFLESAAFRALMGRLRRPNHVFELQDFSYVSGGSHAGAPAVDGAGQLGYALATKGWTPNAPKVLAAGDYITLATKQMLLVVEDANADAAGKVVLNVVPNVRQPPADSSAIEVESPYCVMWMPSFSAPMNTSSPLTTSFSFDVVERILQ